MIPNDPERPYKASAQHTEEALDEALTETFPASDAINLRQWNEMEATREARAAREARIKERATIDRLSHYFRGPTAFSA
jgi:hypothetical protein